VDLLETSVGHGWQKGPRNSPTVLNAVYNIAQFWDGRARDLKEQAMGPVQAAVEMNSTPQRTVTTLRSIPAYVDRFKQAFPGEADPVTFENMARAIESFEATLVTPNSRFDQYLGGNRNAIDAREKKGLDIFITKGCFEVTRTASDEYVFKSPSLRNIELTAPYFHSGKVWDLRQAVAVMGSAQLGATLDQSETEAIVAFLKTLTGVQPQVDYPVLPPHTATTPLPDTRLKH
jgi:cytochrome c peroxidase